VRVLVLSNVTKFTVVLLGSLALHGSANATGLEVLIHA